MLRVTPAVLLILVVAMLPVLVSAAELLRAEWTYTLTGSYLWAGISGDGATVFAYDSDKYLYIIGDDGDTKIISRPGALARDIRDNLIIGVPPTGDFAYYAVYGETGQIYTAIDGNGNLKWSFFVPGQTILQDISPNGDVLVVAYRSNQPSPGETKIIINTYKDGKLAGSFPLSLPGITQAASLRVAVSDTALITLYNPSAEEIRVYQDDGTLLWSVRAAMTPDELCIAPKGDHVVATYKVLLNNTLLIYYYINGNNERAIKTVAKDYSISPECDYLAYYDNTSTVYLLSVITGEKREIATLPRVTSLAVSENGEYILVASSYNYYIYNMRGVLVGNGFSLSLIQKGLLSSQGKAGVIVDMNSRLYYFRNPEARRLDLTIQLLALGVLFMAGLVLLLRASRGKPQPEEHDEEIFPA